METSPDHLEGSFWKPVIAAALAILVGIGLSRFAYSPLIPAVVEAGWFTPAQAAYLGAANLAGYLIGALAGQRLAAVSSPRVTLRMLMVVASLVFIASAFPVSFGWFLLWRLLSGITGGALMVLAAPTVLPQIPPRRRGLASGAIFTGVGLGIVLSGALVPILLSHGLSTTWIAIGGLSFAATGIAWLWWPAAAPGTAAASRKVRGDDLRRHGLPAIYASYGLIAIGLVPHMVFLVDFVARGLGAGIAAGGHYWIMFGIGALVGPLVAGRLADWLGFGPSLRLVLLFHALSAGLIAFSQSELALTISSLIVGSAVSGTVPLVLGQTQERVSTPEAQKAAWTVATATFALGQAAAGYAYSSFFAATGEGFEPLFLIGATALLLALLTNLFATPVPSSACSSRQKISRLRKTRTER